MSFAITHFSFITDNLKKRNLYTKIVINKNTHGTKSQISARKKGLKYPFLLLLP